MYKDEKVEQKRIEDNQLDSIIGQHPEDIEVLNVSKIDNTQRKI